MLLIGTLENVRLRAGDRIVVSLGSGEYQVEVVNAGDPAKLKIRLTSGLEVWIGRRAILSVQEPGNV